MLLTVRHAQDAPRLGVHAQRLLQAQAARAIACSVASVLLVLQDEGSGQVLTHVGIRRVVARQMLLDCLQQIARASTHTSVMRRHPRPDAVSEAVTHWLLHLQRVCCGLSPLLHEHPHIA